MKFLPEESPNMPERAELTLSVQWAAHHPDLFALRVREFKAIHTDYKITVKIERNAYIVYTAVKKCNS